MQALFKNKSRRILAILKLLPLLALLVSLCACSSGAGDGGASGSSAGTASGGTTQNASDGIAASAASSTAATTDASEEPDTSRYLVAVEDEPDTVDFQRTTLHYTIAQNVFDRLVEMDFNARGEVSVMPSLAKSWEISDDRCRYTFHLRESVTFSNGSPLTAEDVGFTLTRLLAHPDSNNRDIAESIKGAAKLESGETDELEGFEAISDLDFVITLEEPSEAFLACMSMPGASIMDAESVEKVGDQFGMDPESTVGTGPFILREWNPGEGMILVTNPDCWSGRPKCEGLDLRFLTEAEAVRELFENGEMDILDLDELGNYAEYYIHGDIYQDRLHKVQQIGIAYLALNESIEPLQDERVRKALQLSLNRIVLVDAVDSGRGYVENGIYPHGLIGFNPELPEIPYDPDQARALLALAGYEDGFDLTITVRSSSASWYMTLATLASHMWKEIGVRARIHPMEESEFMRLRKSGEIACYPATWIADYDDPDNFIYTFFGSPENTTFRSLCYPDKAVMERVRKARAIADSEDRIAEYQALEEKIVQEDAAWIPLFSRQRYYVTSERVEGFRASWNGSVKNNYRRMSIRES